MAKKNNRKRSFGWADTKRIPHKKHPANFRRNGRDSDNVKYLTFTHSPIIEIKVGDKIKVVHTIPLTDNISKKERAENKRNGLKAGENRSYVFPLVFNGSRSALGKNNEDYSPVPADRVIIDTLFLALPEMVTPVSRGLDKSVKNKNSHKK